VHVAAWPTRAEVEALLPEASAEQALLDQQTYELATDVLFEVRKQRSEAKQPLKIPITKVTITAEPSAAALMRYVEADLKAALRVQRFEITPGDPRAIVVGAYETAQPS
jgi:hypothetical protein